MCDAHGGGAQDLQIVAAVCFHQAHSCVYGKHAYPSTCRRPLHARAYSVSPKACKMSTCLTIPFGVMHAQEREEEEEEVSAVKQSKKRAKTGANPKTAKSTGPRSATATKADGTDKKTTVKHSLLRLVCCHNREQKFDYTNVLPAKKRFRNVDVGRNVVEAR